MIDRNKQNKTKSIPKILYEVSKIDLNIKIIKQEAEINLYLFKCILPDLIINNIDLKNVLIETYIIKITPNNPELA